MAVRRNTDWMIIRMKDLRGIAKKDKMHYLQCPDCGEWFDMGDMAAVVAHQHWVEEKPQKINCSHVRRVGNESEFYLQAKRQMLTLQWIGGGNSDPHQRA